MADQFVKGTPPLALFPASNYVFKVSEGHYKITMPRKGSYHEIDPAFFPEDSGEFNIYDEESKILYLPSITKVLFAAKKYPELAFNQFFVPYSLQFTDEDVIIIGQVIDMMVVKKGEEGSDIATEEV